MHRVSLVLLFASCLAIEGNISAQTTVFQAFPIPPGPVCFAYAITTGPDGNVWFTCTGDVGREASGEHVGRITPNGEITLFATPTRWSGPDLIAAGPDGNVWFTEITVDKIARITPAGVITEFGTGGGSPIGITAGPDGAVWFTDLLGNKIGRITMEGTITKFSVPTPASRPWAITAGPDGALWFTEAAGNKIGRITTDGQISEFAIPTPNARPGGIRTGLDGALWFRYTGQWDKIGRITTSGTITEFPLTAGSGERGIVLRVHDALWFPDFINNKIFGITPQGTIKEFALPAPFTGPTGITVGSDGALWFADGLWIGRLTFLPIPRSRPVRRGF